ncbi:MAG: bis(5'-nucleosyl)-tetraphosphatase (symmetrical) YqeK [Chloroflexota bacterium]|jgi:predicted HD superfamily hydrolase involved in NAD metabolism|nr:bis(5'-nucleosyl)-tetraphosphatase (symmetrical) YqeK [Dehalococcoidia bacterium]MDW8047836.1 bis(5'-nucleosyl)-tetraphosphatase (symmetrical) YqeK [Chloroflexota bacterium]
MAGIRTQIEAVREAMAERPPGLLRHVERVLREALLLAHTWDLDPDRVELAAWGHDLFRAHPPQEQLRLARDLGLAVDPDDERSPIVLHGPIAAAVLRERFGVTDADVLEAIASHTLGLERMSILAKVILIADKVEAVKRRRDWPMRLIRAAAHRDLDLALLCWADWKWVEERRHGWAHHAQHWRARREWVAEHHLDRAGPLRVPDAELEAFAEQFLRGSG